MPPRFFIFSILANHNRQLVIGQVLMALGNAKWRHRQFKCVASRLDGSDQENKALNNDLGIQCIGAIKYLDKSLHTASCLTWQSPWLNRLSFEYSFLNCTSLWLYQLTFGIISASDSFKGTELVVCSTVRGMLWIWIVWSAGACKHPIYHSYRLWSISALSPIESRLAASRFALGRKLFKLSLFNFSKDMILSLKEQMYHHNSTDMH